MRLSALGSDANFVGYNDEAAVSNLFAEGFRFSKRLLLLYQPLICYKSKLACCLLITQFHTLHISAQAKSVYLRSGVGKNATTIAIR